MAIVSSEIAYRNQMKSVIDFVKLGTKIREFEGERIYVDAASDSATAGPTPLRDPSDAGGTCRRPDRCESRRR
jgi:hypothetical protein